jgi:hypothetical protein
MSGPSVAFGSRVEGHKPRVKVSSEVDPSLKFQWELDLSSKDEPYHLQGKREREDGRLKLEYDSNTYNNWIFSSSIYRG